LTIFSSGSGVGLQSVSFPIFDGSGKLLRPGTGYDKSLEQYVPHYVIAASAQKPVDPTIQVVDEAELKVFLAQAAVLMNNRDYIPQLDKHSEQAVWQAVRMQQKAIADWIKSSGLVKIKTMKVNIHTEREMCGQCAATSAEMVANLASHAPEIAEALKTAGGGQTQVGTDVTSTHKFGGAAPAADPASATAATPRAQPPSGKTKADPKNPGRS
jgi:hypothetical protein